MLSKAKYAALVGGVWAALGAPAIGRPSIEVIGPLPAPFTSGEVNDCADPACQVVMLSLRRVAQPVLHAFRWSSGAGFTDLSAASGLDDMSVAYVSDDGLAYVCNTPNNGPMHHWVPPAAPVPVVFPTGINRRQSRVISADGGVFAGTMAANAGSNFRGYVWSSAAGVVDMNFPVGHAAAPGWISADGGTVIGEVRVGTHTSGFRWTSAGATYFDGVGGVSVQNVTASPDGATIVGRTTGVERLTVWVDGVPHDYGQPPAPYDSFTILGVGNGGTVVGYMTNTSNGNSKGFIWKKNMGFRDAGPYLVQLGVVMPGWDVFQIYDVSDDGGTVVGRGNLGLFRIQNAIPPACDGDFNGDGAVNTADLTALLPAFGTCPASVGYQINLNIDESDPCITTADLVAFLGTFGTSCP